MKTDEHMHDLGKAIMGLSFNSLHAGSPRQDVQRAYGEGFDRCKREAAELAAATITPIEDALKLALGALSLHDFEEAKRIGAMAHQATKSLSEV